MPRRAAKAAVMTVLNDEIVITTQITLPKGESISIDITDTQIDGDSVTCTVKKYSGDDPDITQRYTCLCNCQKK